MGDIGFYYDFYTNTLRFHRYFNEFFTDSGIFIDIVFQIPRLPRYFIFIKPNYPFFGYLSSVSAFFYIDKSFRRHTFQYVAYFFSPTI